MLLPAILAASILPLDPLDEAWARLARDAAAHDPVAIAADRAEIVRLDREEMARWSAKPRETFRGRGYTATT